MRGLQRAARVSFPAARGVAERNRICGRIKTDFVRPGVRSGAIRTQRKRTGKARAAHLLGKLFERAGERIFLGRVVNLPAPGLVFRVLREELGRSTNDFKKQIHAHRKIRTID